MQENRFDAIAWWLHRHGVRPNHISHAQIPFLLAMVWSGLERDLLAFFVLQLVTIFLDGADGILARRTGTSSRRGHLLDSFYDIMGIAVTLWFASHLYPDAPTGLPFSLPDLLFLLLVVNFLVYAQNEIQGTKAVTYTRGPVTAGIVLEAVEPGFLVIGVVLPLLFGLILLFTRVAWRQRIWNWYQFLTAGRRKEYRAIEKRHRAGTRLSPEADAKDEASTVDDATRTAKD